MHDHSRDLPCYMRNGEPPHPKAKAPGAARRGRSTRVTLRFPAGTAGLAATVDAGFGGASALASGLSARAGSSASTGSGLDAAAAARGVGTTAAGRGVATAVSLVVGAMRSG
jgi:hypothetical protein